MVKAYNKHMYSIARNIIPAVTIIPKRNFSANIKHALTRHWHVNQTVRHYTAKRSHSQSLLLTMTYFEWMTLGSHWNGPSTGCLRVLPTLRPSYQTNGSGGYQHHGRLYCFDTANFWHNDENIVSWVKVCLFVFDVAFKHMRSYRDGAYV